MSRYSRYAKPSGYVPFITCSICRSDRRMFVQCVPCCLKFNAAWGVGEFQAAEEYEYEQIPQFGEHPYEDTNCL